MYENSRWLKDECTVVTLIHATLLYSGVNPGMLYPRDIHTWHAWVEISQSIPNTAEVNVARLSYFHT